MEKNLILTVDLQIILRHNKRLIYAVFEVEVFCNAFLQCGKQFSFLKLGGRSVLGAVYSTYAVLSQQLGDTDEVSLLQIFKPRERSVEILRQVEHLLRHLNNVLFFTFRYLN